MNLENSFYDIYLIIYKHNFFLQEVCRKLIDLNFHNLIEIFIYYN